MVNTLSQSVSAAVDGSSSVPLMSHAPGRSSGKRARPSPSVVCITGFAGPSATAARLKPAEPLALVQHADGQDVPRSYSGRVLIGHDLQRHADGLLPRALDAWLPRRARRSSPSSGTTPSSAPCSSSERGRSRARRSPSGTPRPPPLSGSGSGDATPPREPPLRAWAAWPRAGVSVALDPLTSRGRVRPRRRAPVAARRSAATAVSGSGNRMALVKSRLTVEPGGTAKRAGNSHVSWARAAAALKRQRGGARGKATADHRHSASHPYARDGSRCRQSSL